MKVALDTNVLAYAEGIKGVSMKDAAVAVIEKLPADSTVLSVQVLGELFNLLVAKAGFSRQRARSSFLSWQDSFPVVENSPSVMLAAVELASHHGLKIWDSVVLSAAISAGCRLLLSEDLQDGFTVSGVTVVDPFAKKRHPLLADLLES